MHIRLVAREYLTDPVLAVADTVVIVEGVYIEKMYIFCGYYSPVKSTAPQE